MPNMDLRKGCLCAVGPDQNSITDLRGFFTGFFGILSSSVLQ